MYSFKYLHVPNESDFRLLPACNMDSRWSHFISFEEFELNNILQGTCQAEFYTDGNVAD